MNTSRKTSLQTVEELEMIRLARRGDTDAFCRLYGLYQRRLYRYAFYRLGNETDAEDAVSECVLSAWRQIGALRDAEAFPAWIFRILSGCCGKLIQQQIQRRQQISLDEPAISGADRMTKHTVSGIARDLTAGAASGSSGKAGDADTWLILQEALAGLSEEERNIVLLSAVGGLKSHEIAALTGKTAGSIRSSLSRSLKKIRGYLS